MAEIERGQLMDKRVQDMARIMKACSEMSDEMLESIALNVEGVALGYKIAVKQLNAKGE